MKDKPPPVMEKHEFKRLQSAPRYCGFFDGSQSCFLTISNPIHDVAEPPAAHFTAQDLALIRATILRVIDDGDDAKTWEFYAGDFVAEHFANEQRLRFCDAIQQQLVAAAKQAK